MFFKFLLRITAITLIVILQISKLTLAQIHVNAGNDTAVCAGSSAHLHAVASGGTAPYTYKWIPATGLSSTTVSNPTATPSVTTTYTVTAKDGNGFTATDAIIVTIYPKPTVIISPNPVSVCIGSTVTLTASGANTYIWSNSKFTDTIKVHPTSAIVYTVTGTSVNGCTNTASVAVTVVSYPVAGFTFSPNDSCANTTVFFTNTSTGSSLTYLWNFGDPASGVNNTSTLANPTHTFSSAVGNGVQSFTVTMAVTSAGLCSNSISHTVTVKQSPDPTLIDPMSNFNNCASASSSNQDFLITVQNASTTNNTFYTIIWGDGTPNYDNTAFSSTNHTYTTLGIFYLIFQVTGANGCINSATYQVKNISNPAISFGNPGNTQGCAPKTICFPITGYANNDTSTTYSINFGDGSPTINIPRPLPDSICYTYTTTSCGQNGTGCTNCFVVTMTAMNACDTTKVTTSNIKIYTKPIAVIGSLPTGCVNQPVTFADSSILGFNNLCTNSAFYTWNFGTGGPDTTVNSTTSMVYTYTTSGTYIVTLITDNYCHTDTTKDTICINPTPVARFSINDSVFCSPDSVLFNNLSSASNPCGNAVYTWTVNCMNDSCISPSCAGYSFIQGTNINSYNPVIKFTQPGHYTIQLTFANSCNPPGTYSKSIRVESKPAISLNGVPTGICNGDSITPSVAFTQCYSNVSSFLWSFPGGSPVSSTSQNPGTIVYNTLGTFNVSIKITNGCGDSTYTQPIIINPVPFIAPINTISVCPDSLITIGNFSSAPPGAIFSWKNNDTLIGLPLSGNGNIPSWNAPANNTGSNITGTITVTPSLNGCLGTPVNFNITIYPLPNVTVNSPVICLGQPATLTASGANTYFWSTSATTNPIIVIPANDTTYIVTGTNTTTGCSKSDTSSVIVHTVPIAAFNNDTLACTGTLVQFNNSTTGAQSYLWEFGDSDTSTLFNPAHAYSSPGNYIIYLIATSTCGKDSIPSSISVIQPPTPAFTVSPVDGCAPLSVIITNHSTGTNINYFWNFGIPPPSNGSGPFIKLYPQGYNDTTYHITLKDSNACGSFLHTDSVTVYPKPEINFGMSQNYGCSPITVQFINIVNSIDTLIWNFGDGSPVRILTSFSGIISHTFTYYGTTDTTYTITLIGINACGKDTLQKTFTVYPNTVTAFFNVDTLSGCVPLTVHFTNYSTGGTTYSWNFGDGNFSNLPDPTHTYTSSGQYVVMLAVTNGCSYDTVYSVPIKVYAITVPYFTIKKDSTCEGDTVFFINPPAGMISYSWNFGDGSPIDSNTTPYHIYNNPGIYQVTLTIINQHCSSDTTIPVYIRFKPASNFTVIPNIGCSPLSVQFNNTTDSLSYNTYIWNFNNGNTSVLINPAVQSFINKNHCVDTTYQVSIIANNDGCIDTFYSYINVHPTPLSNFTTSDSTFCCFNPPKQIQFYQETPCANFFQWFVNNSIISTATNPLILFSNTGDYNVSLVVSNQYNCRDTSTKTYIVYPNWKNQVSISPASGCEPLGVQFMSLTDSLDYLWEFGDSSTSTEQNVFYVYTHEGLYTVQIDVKGIGGCVDSLIFHDTINVFPRAKAAFTYENITEPSPDNGTVLFNNTSLDASSYIWNFGDGTMFYGFDTTHRYLYNNNFDVILIANNIYNCPDTFTVHINLDFLNGLYIPNAFSPASTNPLIKNFQPVGIGLETYHIQVYDTWGNLLWESEALDDEGRPAEFWNGELKNGKKLPMDVYVWKATGVFINGEVWQGMDYGDGKPKTYGTVTIIK
ncbi:MAG: PKD domain-containing protein [Bacteroidales bacterium]